MNIKTCRHCDITFSRPDDCPIPADRCEDCHWEIDAMKVPLCTDGTPCGEPTLGGERFCEACPINGALPKQARYQDSQGGDWIDEFARTATPEEFRGAMKFTVGKYLRRAGKKDSMLSEVRKMRDYCQRWEQYERELEQ